jgi:hypothetical protein
MALQDILDEAQALSHAERRELIKLLVDTLTVEAAETENSQTKRRSILELRGLGKEIWQNIDAQEYLNQLRDEWDEQS